MRKILIGLMMTPMMMLADVIWTCPDEHGCRWGYELIDGKAVIREHSDDSDDPYWYGAYYECGIDDSCHLGALVVPTDVDGYPVVSVELESDQPYVTAIYIPETVTNVTSLGYVDGLKKVVITNAKTIGAGCLDIWSLESIKLPTTVERFGAYVFNDYNCYNVTSLEYDVSLAQWLNVELTDIGSSPFCVTHRAPFMDELGGVLRIPDYVREVKPYQFSSIENIRRIEFGSNVEEVGNYAFERCAGVKEIDADSLVHLMVLNPMRMSCLENLCLSVAGEVVQDIVLPEGVQEIPAAAFYGYTNLTSVVIPEGVTNIGGSAFYGCKNLKTVTLPQSLKTIGSLAFSEAAVERFCIPAGIESVGWRAFQSRNSVTVDWPDVESMVKFHVSAGANEWSISGGKPNIVEIPGSVVRIPERTFANEVTLERVILHEGVEIIGATAFSGCTMLRSIDIPASLNSIENGSFSGCNALREVRICDLSSWCRIAFAYGANPLSAAHNLYLNGMLVTDLVIPDGIEMLNSYTFSGATNIASVAFPSSVASLADSSFEGCVNIKKVVVSDLAGWCVVSFPSAVANPLSVAHELYVDDVRITDLIIPEGVSAVKNYAFTSATNLISVSFPSSIASVENTAFDGCTSLKKVSVSDLASWCGVSFWSASANPLAVAHDLYVGEERITELVIPDGVRTIGNYAFKGATNLVSVSFPASVTSVGNAAFNGCGNLKKVFVSDLASWCGVSFATASDNPLAVAHELYVGDARITELDIPEGVQTIRSYAFSGATNIQQVAMPAGIVSIGSWAFSDCVGLASVDVPSLENWRNVTGASELFAHARNVTIKGQSVDTITLLDADFGCCIPGVTNIQHVVVPADVTLNSRSLNYFPNLKSVRFESWFPDVLQTQLPSTLETIYAGEDFANWLKCRKPELAERIEIVEISDESSWAKYLRAIGSENLNCEFHHYVDEEVSVNAIQFNLSGLNLELNLHFFVDGEEVDLEQSDSILYGVSEDGKNAVISFDAEMYDGSQVEVKVSSPVMPDFHVIGSETVEAWSENGVRENCHITGTHIMPNYSYSWFLCLSGAPYDLFNDKPYLWGIEIDSNIDCPITLRMDAYANWRGGCYVPVPAYVFKHPNGGCLFIAPPMPEELFLTNSYDYYETVDYSLQLSWYGESEGEDKLWSVYSGQDYYSFSLWVDSGYYYPNYTVSRVYPGEHGGFAEDTSYYGGFQSTGADYLEAYWMDPYYSYGSFDYVRPDEYFRDYAIVADPGWRCVGFSCESSGSGDPWYGGYYGEYNFTAVYEPEMQMMIAHNEHGKTEAFAYTVLDEPDWPLPEDVEGWHCTGWRQTGDGEMVAEWEVAKHTLTVETLYGEAEGNGAYEYGTTVPLVAPQPVVTEKSKKLVCLGSTSHIPATNEFSVLIKGDMTICWDIWQTNYWLTANAGKGGSVVCPDTGWCTNKARTTITAIPDVGMRLLEWTRDVSGCSAHENELDVVMNRARQITATFVEEKVAKPVISTGDYRFVRTMPHEVTIQCATPNAKIYYSTNGVAPQISSKYLYKGAFKLNGSANIMAVAVKTGADNSDLATSVVGYVPADQDLPEVVVMPESAVKNGRFMITMTYPGIEGIETTVRYTINAGDPNGESTAYAKRFQCLVEEETFIRAAAFVGDVRVSDIVTVHYLPTIADAIVRKGEGCGEVAVSTASDNGWVFDEGIKSPMGANVMRSARGLPHLHDSVMTAEIEGAGVFEFAWRTSCEWDDSEDPILLDYAICLLDGEKVALLDGVTDWERVVVPVGTPGAHTITWIYHKDDYDDLIYPGEDCAWVSDVKFTFAAYVDFASDEPIVGSLPETIVSAAGYSVELPELGDVKYDKHIFAGWRYGEIIYQPGDKLIVNRQSITLKPVWLDELVVSFDVGYETQDGPSPIASTMNTEIELPDIGEAHLPCHDFVGWLDSGYLYRAGDAYSVTGNVTLVASWMEKRLEKPVIDVLAEYDEPSTVVTITAGDGEGILYTVDGSDPNDKGVEYNGPFVVSGSVKVRAVATADDFYNSEIAEVETVCIYTPVSVAFSIGEAAGNAPAVIATALRRSFILPGIGDAHLDKHRFIGWSDGVGVYEPGCECVATGGVTFAAVWKAKKLIAPQIEVPTSYDTEKTMVKIESVNGEGAVRYTVDGTIPSAMSEVYSGPFEVTGSVTIRAIAIADDWFDSEISAATTKRAPWTIGEILNNADLSFSVDGAEWVRDRDVSHDGVASLRSGKIGDRERTCVSATVEGEGVISFWYKTSCEADGGAVFDGLRFYVDGVGTPDDRSDPIGGVMDWAHFSLRITGNGSHTLTWQYEKDRGDYSDVGEDCVWIDDVEWLSGSDAVDLVAIFGADSEVVRQIAGNDQTAAFVSFVKSCGIVDVAQLNVVQKEYAYKSFKLSEITTAPQLFEEEPVLKIDDIELTGGNLSLTISLTAGAEAILLAKDKLAEKIRIGSTLGDITGKPTIVVGPAADGASLMFTVTPPKSNQGFVKVQID